MDISSLTELAPPVLLVAVLNMIGWAIKSTTIPNKYIPWFMMAIGGVAYPFVAEKAGPMITAAHPLAHAVLTGILIGGAATGVFEATRALRPSKNETEPTQPTPPK